MASLYEGDINRLLIFAGHSGSGKTSFLNTPSARLSVDLVPSEIDDLHELAPLHANVMNLKDNPSACLDRLCLHVDLSRPTRQLRPIPKTRSELLERIGPEIFSSWRQLKSYCDRASEVHVITLFVRREAHFRRWAEYNMRKDVRWGFRRTALLLNGDTTNHCELHRSIYSAWEEFVQSLVPRSLHVIDGDKETSSFMDPEDYRRELKTGYGS